MATPEDMTSMLISMALAVVLVTLCVLVHYEVLRLASKMLPSLTIRPRNRILFIMAAAFFAHTIEIWIFGIAYWLSAQHLAIGGLIGQATGGFPEFIYFSTVSYTSLGLGDLYPTGAFRLLTGVEALVGLTMIAWTGSFTYLSMQKFWDLHGPKKPRKTD
ncbi:MAG: ion channel [Alphaproteobacteria bacterium]|jgi:hypothetical protein